jgi:hypothetical protein
MKRIENELEQAINSVFETGAGLSEHLQSAVIEANKHAHIFFSLQSKHGIILTTAPEPPQLISKTWEQNALKAIAPENEGTKRFIFSIAPMIWDVITCFQVNDSAFYATIAILKPQEVQQNLCAGIIKLLDLLCNRCRTILLDFVNQLTGASDESDDATIPHYRETMIFKQITEFSNKVKCTALIDNDGFILNTQGSIEVEKTASHLALFHQRCIRELAVERYAHVQSETFSCGDNSVLIGQIQHTNLALAIFVQGKNSKPIVSFLFDTAHSALVLIAQRSNHLWGAPLDAMIEPTRIRDSWFSPAQLAPKGKFVGKKSGKTFHFSTCNILTKSDDKNLEWFDKRVDAIKAGLSPCKSCNP